MFLFCLFLVAQETIELEPILVTATRYPLELQDIPLATLVLDADDLNAAGQLRLAEALRSAGIEIRDYGYAGAPASVNLRGIPASGVLVLVDGRPINSNSTGTADVNALDLRDIARVEVVRGPASNLYGANALGGVVNIVTTDNISGRNLAVDGTVTAADAGDSPAGHIHARGRLPVGRFGLHATGSFDDDPGPIANSDLRGGKAGLGISYEAGTTSGRLSLRGDCREYGVPGPLTSDTTVLTPHDRERDETFWIDMHLAGSLGPHLAWSASGFGDHRFIDWWHPRDGAPTDSFQNAATSVGFSGLIRHAILAAGIDVRRDSLRTRERSTYADTLWNASAASGGVWAQANLSLAPSVTFVPGARIDIHDSYGVFVSPQVGFIWELDRSLLVKGSVGRAFRAPTLNDLYYPQSGNPDLVPEQALAGEVRFEAIPRYDWRLAVSFFRRDVAQRIAWLPAADEFWRPQNVNRLVSQGVDLEIEAQAFPWLILSASFTAMEARQRSREIVYDYYDWNADTGATVTADVERRAAFTPEMTASLRMLVRPVNRLTVMLSMNGSSDQVNYYPNYTGYPDVGMDTKTLPQYVAVDLGARVEVMPGLLLDAGARNVFDQDYATQFGYSMVDHDYPMPRRRVYATLQWGPFGD